MYNIYLSNEDFILILLTTVYILAQLHMWWGEILVND